jgi:excisionase family DNA binding protein
MKHMRHLKKSVAIRDIADHCMVDRVTVRRWVKSGKLPAIKLPSGHYRITQVDYQEFLEKWNIPIEGCLSESKSEEGEGE